MMVNSKLRDLKDLLVYIHLYLFKTVVLVLHCYYILSIFIGMNRSLYKTP